MFDWNDLRYFLAVADAGTTAGAARALGTSQPTVVRRIAALEECCGLPLFDRHALGYRLTPHGEDLLPLARKVGDEVDAFEARVRSRNRSGSAVLRVTMPEATVSYLTSVIVDMRRRYPDTRVELHSDDRKLDLLRGEADVALRAGYNIDRDGLVGRELPKTGWALYASPAYIDACGMPKGLDDLDNHAMIGADGAMGESVPFQWLARQVRSEAIVWRGNTLSALMSAVRAGLGIAPLPCGVTKVDGGVDGSLEPVSHPIPELLGEMWVLTRPELRLDPAVKCLMDLMVANLEARAEAQLGTNIRLRGEAERAEGSA